MKKVFTAIVATLVVAIAAFTPAFAAEETTVPETTAAPYTYSIIDATNIQKELVGFIAPFTEDEIAIYDVDKDGVVSVMDATTIQKMLVGLI